MRNRIWERWLSLGAAAAVAALALSVAPLLMLAPYAGPVTDDFGYGSPVHYALEAGLGLPGVLAALAENIRYTYQYWQGTFGSVLLFSIQPAAFSEGLYVLTAPLMLLTVIAPPFLATLSVRKASRPGMVFVAAVAAMVTVQLLPSPASGFYWWNGAAHYLVFWCLSVLAVTVQIRLARSSRRTVSFALQTVMGCALAFFAGGGNYSTALVLTLCSAALMARAVLDRRGMRAAVSGGLMAASAAAGLLISMTAPGNTVRQAVFTGLDPVGAVLKSFQAALEAAAGLVRSPVVLAALLLCVPVFLASVGKEYRFPCPLLAVAGGFCAWAALYTPPLFVMGLYDVPRLNNLFTAAGLFWLMGSVLYTAGWCRVRFSGSGLLRWAAPRREVLVRVAAALGGLALAVSLLAARTGLNGWLAWQDLSSGAAEAYSQARARRTAVWADKSIPLPRFEPTETIPVCFPQEEVLTWTSDLIIDGVPDSLLCFHSCGGEVTFTPLDAALERFGAAGALTAADLSRVLHVGGQECVPLRELCDRLGLVIGYVEPDTVVIYTGAPR